MGVNFNKVLIKLQIFFLKKINIISFTLKINPGFYFAANWNLKANDMSGN